MAKPCMDANDPRRRPLEVAALSALVGGEIRRVRKRAAGLVLVVRTKDLELVEAHLTVVDGVIDVEFRGEVEK